jgi:maltose/moltooligosaccharide transporter
VLEKFKVSNEAASGIPDTVKISFYIGAVVFIAAVAWTVFTTKEYSPAQMKEFGEFSEADVHTKNIKTPASVFLKRGLIWFLIGGIL